MDGLSRACRTTDRASPIGMIGSSSAYTTTVRVEIRESFSIGIERLYSSSTVTP
jgi:hypothetical protein